jgi:hypothetical protein
MSVGDHTDPDVKAWQQLTDQTLLVNYTAGAKGHGWVQQDPSKAWRDEVSGRWFFLGGTSINGTKESPDGTPIIELFGSRSADDDWSKGFEYVGIFSADGLAMCDPELIIFGANGTFKVGGTAAVYTCDNNYIIGTIALTDNAGYRLVPLSSFSKGPKRFEAGSTSAAKGFMDHSKQLSHERYLLWLTAHSGKSFTIAREVSLDPNFEILLSYPAREWAAMREGGEGGGQVALKGATVDAAKAAMASAPGAPQLDLDLNFSYPSTVPVGAVVGVSLMGGAVSATVTVTNEGEATLQLGKDSSMVFPLHADDKTITLRVIADGSIVEAFAQHGRAQVVSASTPKSNSIALLTSANPTTSMRIDAGAWRLAYPAV